MNRQQGIGILGLAITVACGALGYNSLLAACHPAANEPAANQPAANQPAPVQPTAGESDRKANSSQEPDRPDSVERDYRAELPRVAPLEPAEALESFRVADGFRLELAACEPEVVDPIAMAFDEHGRLFVVEMRGYSEDAEAQLGRIRLLEDRDADGRYEQSQVFAEGLSWPTALLCYDGGLFVAAAPDLLYFRDTDGDGAADQRKLVATGFGKSNVQGLVNSLRWGLDNRIHGATSSSGAALRWPGSESAPLVLRGRDFAWDPRGGRWSATSGGGQHGMYFDAWGDKFVCSNSDHVQQVMFDDHYVARNPYLAAPSPRISIAADGPQADVFRSSPVEPWRVVRTRLRVKGLVPGPVEGGGRAAGYFTGATGITLYDGHAWSTGDTAWAIVGDVGSNLVHRKRLVPEGLEFRAERIDEQSELVASTDIWFRPVQFANGPDGGLYILDMYREVIEHPDSLPPVIKKHLDLTSGRDRGRLYRLVPRGYSRAAPARLGDLPASELVTLLCHPNGWHRETAARLLFQRSDTSVVPALQQLVQAGQDSSLPAPLPPEANEFSRAAGRVRALYLLQSMAGTSLTDLAPAGQGSGASAASFLDAALLEQASRDPHPQVRRHAIRLAETQLDSSPTLRVRLAELAKDPDARVRYQVAFSLGALPPSQRIEPMLELLRRDGGSRWVRLAVRSSLSDGTGELIARVAGDPELLESPWLPAWLEELAGQVSRQQRAEDVARVLRVLADESVDRRVTRALLQGLRPEPGSDLARRLAAGGTGSVAAATQELLREARAQVQDHQLPAGERAEALRVLALGNFAEHGELLAECLVPAEALEVQNAALETLGQYADSKVAGLCLDRWKQLSPRLRTRAGDLLASRQAWADQLVQALETGTIPLGDINPARLKLLAAHPDQPLRQRVARLLEQVVREDRVELVRRYQQALVRPGDAAAGQKVFAKTCAQCHQLGGVGHTIGPSLAAARNRGPEFLLVNILDPNREVNPEFLNYNVVLQDGRALSGMIVAETANSFTLRRAENASDVVLRVDVDVLQSTGQSLMPEGLEREISPEAMVDLLAYLTSTEEAPSEPATRATPAGDR